MKALLIFVLLITSSMSAQSNDEPKLLDGKSITYTYNELGTVKLTFDSGTLSFEWIEGPYAGVKGDGHEYQVKKMGNQLFVSWLETHDSSYITLLIDLDKNEVHSSGIISPKSDDEMVLFHDAKIVTHTLE